MKYLKYVPPEIVAREAREAWQSRNRTDEELWQDLLESGLIELLDNGEVKVCFERPPHQDDNSSGKKTSR